MSSVSYSAWQNQPYSSGNGGASNPDNGPRAKCDQVIFEAIAKASEIIVNGRAAGGQPQHRSYNHQQQASCFGVGEGALYSASGNGGSNNNISNSSRFNLIVPENPGLRQILQKWKYTKSIALRLDLHYESSDCGSRQDNQRELLERWCLEYIPRSHSLFAERECRASDPIVQLRHVCKKIVIWLRTLYCSSRLLPAQTFQHPSCANAPIGFSIYVLTQGSNDLADLIQERGFSCQKQPSTVITPYGELVWEVYSAPKAGVEPYLPPNHPCKAPLGLPRAPSMAGAIPKTNVSAPVAIPDDNRHSNNRHEGDDEQCASSMKGTSSKNDQYLSMPQSAPAGVRFLPPQHNHPQAENERSNQHIKQPSNTYHASRHLYHRSNSDHVAVQDYDFHPVRRRNTTQVFKHASMNHTDESQSDEARHNETDMEQPERLLSGLSLALMSDDQDKRREAGSTEPDASQAEKRRAALHHAPPHWTDQKQRAHPPDNNRGRYLKKSSQQTAGSEYGYAYNNHISWQQIRPSPTVPIPSKGDADEYLNTFNVEGMDERFSRNSFSPSLARLSSSPSPLAGTPPRGAFLRTPGSIGANASLNSPSLIPPRNIAAPPFVRPAGFAYEPESQAQTTEQQMSQQQQQKREQEQMYHDSLTHDEYIPPVSSLDLLHSSPFQQGGSMLSSLSVGGNFGLIGAATYGQIGGMQRNPQHSILPESFMATAARDEAHNDEDGAEYDMPFAVDESVSTVDPKHQEFTITSNGNNNSIRSPAPNDVGLASVTESSTLASSAAVASFAQKCAPLQHRLKLFDSSYGHSSEPGSRMASHQHSQAEENQHHQRLLIGTSSLTDQLAEYRNFGASLSLAHHHNATSGSASEEGAGSAGTPIPLKS